MNHVVQTLKRIEGGLIQYEMQPKHGVPWECFQVNFKH